MVHQNFFYLIVITNYSLENDLVPITPFQLLVIHCRKSVDGWDAMSDSEAEG